MPLGAGHHRAGQSHPLADAAVGPEFQFIAGISGNGQPIFRVVISHKQHDLISRQGFIGSDPHGYRIFGAQIVQVQLQSVVPQTYSLAVSSLVIRRLANVGIQTGYQHGGVRASFHAVLQAALKIIGGNQSFIQGSGNGNVCNCLYRCVSQCHRNSDLRLSGSRRCYQAVLGYFSHFRVSALKGNLRVGIRRDLIHGQFNLLGSSQDHIHGFRYSDAVSFQKLLSGSLRIIKAVDFPFA